jgi:hypothetical protein
MLGCMQSMNRVDGVERSARRSRSEWEREVAQWRSSGRSAADYARERGVKAGTLLWWSAQLKRKRTPVRGVEATPVAFLPLHVRETHPERSVMATGSTIEVILGNGRRVRVVGQVDVEQLERVLAAAEGGDRC